jgi:hypothetical protein
LKAALLRMAAMVRSVVLVVATPQVAEAAVRFAWLLHAWQVQD